MLVGGGGLFELARWRVVTLDFDASEGQSSEDEK